MISDGGAISCLPGQLGITPKEAAIQALLAGIDTSLEDRDCFSLLEEAIEEGSLAQEPVDRACIRVLEKKYEAGLMDEGNRLIPGACEAYLQSGRMQQLAYEMAAESVTLLKNEGGLLPLARTAGVCLMGENAENIYYALGDYTSIRTDTEGTTIRQGMEKSFPGMVWRKGWSFCGPQPVFDREAAEKAAFFTVQLNRHADSPGGHMDETWGRIREAQRKLAGAMEQVYVAPSQDLILTKGDGLHTGSASNVTLGKRLAQLAGSVLCGEEPVFAPQVAGAVWDGCSIELTLEHVRGELKLPEVFDGRPFFQIFDGGEIVPYTVEGRKNRLFLTPQRPLSDFVFINGGSEADPCMHPPYDEETGLPVLAFYHMAVKTASDRLT